MSNAPRLDPGVERVVDALIKADEIIERYRERRRNDSVDTEFNDEPGFTERLLLVQTANAMAVSEHLGGAGPGADAIFQNIETLRVRMMEEVRALVQGEIRKTMGSMQAVPVGLPPVKLVAAEVHAKFEDVLLKDKVLMSPAKRTLELLLTTPEGNEMLKLMLYDAVMIQRKKEGRS
jgi:hypothetical protein